MLGALAEWPVAALLRNSTIAYPLVNAAHILGLGILVGAIATLDLRLLGLFRASPVQQLAPPLWRVAAGGLLLAAATGFLLFSTRPQAYLENPAFLVKLALVALGVLNVLSLHRAAAWRQALDGGAIGMRLKLGAVLSLACWAGAVLAGRWIGFLQ
ncbi:DUF6644 family protein [Teichococcus oryzae]|uniref:DUF2214 family protein n=1 Tax=Teichococcus oryzae TaxID=1608942 RepID=A0A5B2TJ99_9PROT|nr:DUF6644 family protein [Pseudoroseomonas oryzae]KAA2214249.1 DUF2214 family protein [Pseudoroseomonas oryzae]